MDERGLFKLRQKEWIDFKTPEQTRIFLEELLGENRVFPLVVGYSDFTPNGNWRVARLSPLRQTDRLTIENYIQGLVHLQKEIKEGRRLKGNARFNGVDTLHYSNWHSQIMNVAITDLKNPEQTFGLYLYLNHLASEDKTGYAAYSDIPPTPFVQIVERFRGPNRVYEKYPK